MPMHRLRVQLIRLFALGAVALTAGRALAQDVDACIDASERSLALKRAEKLIEARALLSTCAVETCPSAIRETCYQRLAKVVQAIPSVIFAARDGSMRDLIAVKITIDGALYADHLTGAPIVLNPGDHEFRFDVEGEAPVIRRFLLRQGEQERREEIVIGPVPIAPAAQVAAPPRESFITKQRAVGILAGSVGIAGITAGAVTGAMAMSKSSAAKTACPFDGTELRCPASAVNEMNSAKSLATASDVAFGVGALGMVAGVVLFALHPHHEKTAEVTTWADPGSWFWTFMATPQSTEGVVGHAF